MNRIQRLAELFARLPGIGPRQSKRFVYYLLSQPKSFHAELARAITDLGADIKECTLCHRFFTDEGKSASACSICRDTSRDDETLMVIEKDVDLDNIERSHVYQGRYFVLGGSVPILEREPEKKVRIKELKAYIEKEKPKEIIFAFSANPDGDNTRDYMMKELKALAEKKGIKLSELGRGLSTGSELEYSDSETIKNAFRNRQ